MKKILSLFLLLTGLFSAVSAQTAKPAIDSALLYKISGKNLKQPSYIFGTIHVICQNEMFGMDKLNGYLEQTEGVLMELDFDNPAKLQSMASSMSIPAGKSINDFLNAEQYAKIDEMFKNYLGASVEKFKSFHPFMLNVLIATSPKATGCAAPGSYDLNFSQTAAAKKKNVEGLESAVSQMEKVNKRPMSKYAEDLYKMALDPQKAINELKELVVVYKLQNSEELYRKSISGKLGDAEFEKTMLDERNADWIPKIEKSIGEKSTFIAVGAGHLGGKNGVIKLLKAKGYKVEAIKL